MSDEVKIKSKTDVKKIAKGLSEGKFSSEEILDNCRRLWEYASELADRGRRKDGNNGIDFKNIYAIREVCDVIGQLGEHLETDEQKLTVLTMSYRDVIDRLDFFDREHPAEPVERISAEYSFSFLDKIINSIENSDYREEIKKNIDYSRNGSSKEWYSDHRFLDYFGEKSSFKNRANDVARSILLEIERTKEGSETSDLLSKPVLNNKKLNIPYYQVAKQALMNWNGLSEEQAQKIILEQSFEEIDSQVYARGSMDYAIEGIKSSLGLSDKDVSELSTFVYNGGQSKIIDWLRENNEMAHRLEQKTNGQSIITNKTLVNNLIMDTLFHVHDGWVQDNVKKFNAREKKHQHMPSELIGWKEAKADLLFVRPIFEAAGIEVNEEELEQVYNGRVKEFFLDRGIQTARNLSDSITQGEEFYPALKGYGDILGIINDPEYVNERIIPAIEQQGVGNIEEIRRNIVLQIVSNPVPEDVARLSDEEKALVEQSLGQEVSTLTAQRDELHQKNSIVQRIMALAKRRRIIKEEISMEEQRKSENLHEFDD